MSTITPVSPSPVTPPQATAVLAIAPLFKNGGEWHRALGEVPLDRIVFDPWPGTATEADMLYMNDALDRPVELIDGTLVEKAVGYYESLLASLISNAILNFVLPRKMGAVAGEQGMTRVKPGQVRMPDVSYTSFAKMPGGKVSRESISSVVPDLIVEVWSDSNTTPEIDRKLKEFFAAGTKIAWVIDFRDTTVEVYHKPGEPDQALHDGDTLNGEDVLPGFTYSLTTLFHTYD